MREIFISLNSISLRKALLFGTMLSLIYYFFVYDNGKDLKSRLRDTQLEVKELEQKVEETKKIIANQQTVKNEIGSLGRKFKNLLAILPQQLKSSDMVARIQKISKSSGAYVQSIQVDSIEKEDFCFILPISVTLSGNFLELANFIYKIGKEQHLIRVRRLKISPFDSQPRRRILRMNVQLTHYKYNPNAPSKNLGKEEEQR